MVPRPPPVNLVEYVVEVCLPSSQYPYPLLETVGNGRAYEGGQYTKTCPIRGCTPPSSVEYGRWPTYVCPLFKGGWLPGIRMLRGEAVSGTAQADIASTSDAEYA